MTTVFYASTLFGAMSLAAGIDDGRFAEGRRVLIVSNNAAIPEVTVPLDRTPGFAALRSRFDAIHSWNELIAPLHPSEWKARIIEVFGIIFSGVMYVYVRYAAHTPEIKTDRPARRAPSRAPPRGRGRTRRARR